MKIDRRMLLGGAAGLTMLPQVGLGQAAPETWDQKWARMLREDWPGLGRYAADNAKLIASGQKVDVVFMGDSITDLWPQKDPSFFTPGRIGPRHRRRDHSADGAADDGRRGEAQAAPRPHHGRHQRHRQQHRHDHPRAEPR
ncbi:MAG: hypothetical protein WDN44_01995 [Sphingomonas sp.]